MSRFLALSLGLLVALVVPSFASAQLSVAASQIPPRSAFSRLGLEKQWLATVPLGVPHEKVTTISMVQDMFFAQTDLGYLHAYDAETGRYLWGQNLGQRSVESRSVAINSDQVFASDGPMLNCLDRKSGTVIWSKTMYPPTFVGYRTGVTIVGQPVATEEQVIVGLASGAIRAFTTRDHSKDKTPGFSPGTVAWTFQTFGPLTSRPVPTEKLTAFASQDKRLYVARTKPPSVLFRYLTGGPISAALATYGTRTLLVPSEDGTLYAVDFFTGDTKWSLPTGAPLKKEPLVVGDTVYIANTNGLLLAIDAKTGHALWTRETIPGSRFVMLSPTRIYMMTPNHDMVIVDRSTLQVLFTAGETHDRAGVNLREFTVLFGNRTNDRMYFATSDGMLLCVRETGAVRPRTYIDPNAPKFGTIPKEEAPTATTPPAETMPAEGDKPADGADKSDGDEKPKQ